jgi:hypothetical protein
MKDLDSFSSLMMPWRRDREMRKSRQGRVREGDLLRLVGGISTPLALAFYLAEASQGIVFGLEGFGDLLDKLVVSESPLARQSRDILGECGHLLLRARQFSGQMLQLVTQHLVGGTLAVPEREREREREREEGEV